MQAGHPDDETVLWLRAVSALPYSKRSAVLEATYNHIASQIGMHVTASQYPLLITAAYLRRGWEICGIPMPDLEATDG